MKREIKWHLLPPDKVNRLVLGGILWYDENDKPIIIISHQYKTLDLIEIASLCLNNIMQQDPLQFHFYTTVVNMDSCTLAFMMTKN